MEQNTFQLDPFFGRMSFAYSAALSEYIELPVFSIKDTGITRRTMNHWEREGIIVTDRKTKHTWRKFSFVEYVWVKFVEQLRLAGSPLERVLAVREQLFAPIPVRFLWDELIKHREVIAKKVSKEDMKTWDKMAEYHKKEGHKRGETTTALPILIMETIVNRYPVSIVVFNNDMMIPIADNQTGKLGEEAEALFLYETYVKVSLTQIVKSFLYDPKHVFVLPKLQILEDNETRLLEIIQAGDYDSITVFFKDKKMKSVEMKRKHDTQKKIVDILQENEYQNIEIKSHKGLVTTITNTVKMRFE